MKFSTYSLFFNEEDKHRIFNNKQMLCQGWSVLFEPEVDVRGAGE